MSVTVNRNGDVGIIVIDNPPVNAASHAVRAGLIEALDEANRDAAIRAIVIACNGRTFVAGADIKEFADTPKPPFLTEVTEAIETSAKPIVVSLHGTVLGGGFEIALAAHARVAAADAQFGLPEVKLGLVPGAGGTQRLPRLAGVPKAIELVASGRRIRAQEALAIGVVDRIADGDHLAAAVELARGLIGTAPRRTGSLPLPEFDRGDAERQIEVVEKKARGQVSPGHAARLVLAAADMTLREGLAAERACFLDLVSSEQSRALRYVFAAERAAAKVSGLEGTEPRPVHTVGIVGSGLMGSGIAVSALDAGYRVVVAEQSEEAAEKGRERITGLIDRAVKSGRIDAAGRLERLERLLVTHTLENLAAADLVIEAVFDDLTVKSELFAKLDGIVRPDAVLATNTSYLDPDAIAAATSRPARVLGLHFFSPANVMRLVEVVRCANTAPDVLATGIAVARRLGKLPVVCGVCEGFIGNRIFSAYRREAEFLVEDGAWPEQIDAAMEGFGFAMGPFAVFDLAGLEIAWARRKRQAATRDARERYVEIADRLCEMGRFGQKTGSGWYRYPEGRRTVDPDVTALIEACRKAKGIVPRQVASEEIVARLVGAMATEGRGLLTEGIAERASDIDLVLINGYGFPAYRGGPMYLAKEGEPS